MFGSIIKLINIISSLCSLIIFSYIVSSFCVDDGQMNRDAAAAVHDDRADVNDNAGGGDNDADAGNDYDDDNDGADDKRLT